MFEINLVPDVKAEMIHAQKVRNFVFFLCFTVAAVAIGAVVFLVAIKAGQDIRMTSQDSSLKLMSEVLGEYDGLDELLTIQDQLNKLEEVGNNKKVLSRVFNILNTLLPTGEDRISVSSLDINLDENTLAFEAQAYAGEEPKINYRVLEAFSKSIALMRYDYGRYVDENGNEIPTRCIVETQNGNALTENGAIYALWAKNVKGCDPSKVEETATTIDEEALAEEVEAATSEEGSDEAVRIYRTPRINQTNKADDWYFMTNASGGRVMELDGTISGVPHFESQCIKYSGVVTGNEAPQWGSTNSCELAQDPGIQVSDSTDAVETGGDRVLRFNAIIYLNEEVFKFSNKHMLAIAPTGKTNVTDSFIQIGEMFAERAEDVEGEK